MRHEQRPLRPRIPFRSVNRRDRPGYDSQMQRHHLPPRQLMTKASFRTLLESVDRRRVGFDDFRINGMLLPGREESALLTGLPLHRGPHRHYNDMVIERVGQIEQDWSVRRGSATTSAGVNALMRLTLLKRLCCCSIDATHAGAQSIFRTSMRWPTRCGARPIRSPMRLCCKAAMLRLLSRQRWPR
jgi:hypothetical protein